MVLRERIANGQVIDWTARALSLRNLVSGCECGRVFPAGVGPGSPSRDAVNGCLRHSAGRLRRGGGMV